MGTRTKKLEEKKPAKKNPGTPAHKPTEETIQKVEFACVMGTPHEQIAKYIGISVNTLKKYYAEELENAATDKNNQIANTLFQKALNGDTACLIFWAKTRMGWKETHIQELKIPKIRLFEEKDE